MSKMYTVNQGYIIQAEICLKDNSYVLGYNPHAPAPYVTWESNSKGFSFGHYFANEEDATMNFIIRAIRDLPENQIDRLALSILSEEATQSLIRRERDAMAMEDIENCFQSAAENLNLSDGNANTLLSDPEFQNRAMNIYDNIDHSAENEALTDCLETLVRTHFPQFLLENEQRPSLDNQIQLAQNRQGRGEAASPAPTRTDTDLSI